MLSAVSEEDYKYHFLEYDYVNMSLDTKDKSIEENLILFSVEFCGEEMEESNQIGTMHLTESFNTVVYLGLVKW